MLSQPIADSQPEPALSPDEYLIMLSIDPKFTTRAERDAGQKQRVAQSMFDEQTRGVPAHDKWSAPFAGPGATATQGIMGPGYDQTMDPSGRGIYAGGEAMSGGFVFGPLLRMFGVPLLQGVLGNLANRMTSSQTQSGSGASSTWTANVTPDLAERWFASNPQGAGDLERVLAGSSGRMFYRNLLAILEDNLAQILPQVAGMSPQAAQHAAKLASQGALSRSFAQYLEEPDAQDDEEMAGSGIYAGGFGYGNVSAPVVHWALRRMFDKGTANNYYRSIKQKGAFAPATVSGSGMFGESGPRMDGGSKKGWYRFWRGAKNVFSKIGNFAKGVLNTILPGIIPMATKIAPKFISKATEGIISKFGISGDTANAIRGVSDAVSSIPRQMQEGTSLRDAIGNVAGPAYEAAQQIAPRLADKAAVAVGVPDWAREKMAAAIPAAIDKAAEAAHLKAPAGSGRRRGGAVFAIGRGAARALPFQVVPL